MKNASRLRKLLVLSTLISFVLALSATNSYRAALAQGTPTWTQLSPANALPPPRGRHAAVYDPTSNALLVYGGLPAGCGAPLGDLWRLSNANGIGGAPQWTQITPAGPQPPARSTHRTVYDVANDRMIMFGGNPSTHCASLGQFNDVWVLSGALRGTPTWTQLATSGTTPPGLSTPAVAYDAVHSRLIVFGGNTFEGSCGTETNAVYTLSNANGLGGAAVWTNLSPAGIPPAPRWHVPGVYDPNTDAFMVFGGGGTCAGSTTAPGNDTWVLKNVSSAPQWVQLLPSSTPSPRAGHTALYDTSLNQMIVFGGFGPLNETWVLAGANGVGTPNWTLLSPTASLPAARANLAAGYDIASLKMMIFGGEAAAGDLNDTWVLALGVAPCVPLPQNIVSWWPGEGDTNDIIGGSNGTWMGNPGFASGKVASAFNFGGSSYITMGTPSSLNITGNQVTIDGWINPSVNNNAIYLGKTANGFNDCLLLFGFNGLIGIIKAGGTESIVETLFVPPVNQWTHIALTYDGATMKLYANGTMIGSRATTGNIDGDASEFAIGGRALDFSGTHLFFTGKIDEVEVFNRALSDSEIASIYNAGSAGKCKQATNQTPVAKCKSVIISADASCMANASIDDGSFDPDAGDTIRVQQSPPGPYSLGSTLVALTVTDSHGASSECTATVTVVDVTPPTITCPANFVIDESNNPGQCSAVVNYNATATDNCSGVTVACSPSSGSVFPKGPTTVTCTATDSSGNTSSCSFTVTVIPPQLTALGPATVWIGLKNSDDVGTKFDLLGEVFKSGTLVGSGQLDNVPGGSSGFNNAVLTTINLALSAPVDICSGDALSLRLSVRIASTSGHRAGTARLWFNDSPANSGFGATIGGAQQSYYLENGFLLSLAPGSGPKNTIDVTVDRAVGGNPFKPFGTWGITF